MVRHDISESIRDVAAGNDFLGFPRFVCKLAEWLNEKRDADKKGDTYKEKPKNDATDK